MQVDAGSRLAAALGTDALTHCYSVHHQGLAQLGDGLVPEPYKAGSWKQAVRDAVLLDTLVLGLAAGQPTVVSGEPPQAPGASG